jgi:predicted esterase
MESKSFEIKTIKTQRYFTHGDLKKTTKLLIVLHGYGQLAEHFIRKFHQLPENYYIVAPEAMHHFYLNGSSGRVGASWMTKEARLDNIADNNEYLNNLVDFLQKEKQFSEVLVLGFSQGGATAARWNAQRKDIDQLIHWASVFPPDLEESSFSNSKNGTFVIGKHDEFYDAAAQDKEINKYRSLSFKIVEYDGKHDIDVETLKNLLVDNI